MARLERMPAVLDRVEIGGLLHEVVALDGRRIDRVRILKRPA
jgi:CBS domain containing-hemolysin-like protein